MKTKKSRNVARHWLGLAGPGGPQDLAGHNLKQHMDLPSCRPATQRKDHRQQVHCGLGGSNGQRPRRPNPWTMAIRTRDFTLLEGRSQI